MSPEKRAERKQDAFGSWFVGAAVGALVVGATMVPTGAVFATPPPSGNNTSCVQRLLCCFGSPGGAPESGVELQLTEVDRPRRTNALRRGQASVSPDFLYVATTVSQDLILRDGLPASRSPGTVTGYLSGDNTRTTPTASPRVAFDDAQRLRSASGLPAFVVEYRATPDSFDLTASIDMHIVRRQRASSEQAANHDERLRRTSVSARNGWRWVTVGEIRSEEIQRVVPITDQTSCPPDGQGHEGGGQGPFPHATRNPDYVNQRTRVSPVLLTWPTGWAQ